MARPTEPGYYWLNQGGEDPNQDWKIVSVEPVDWWEGLAVWFTGWEGPSKVSSFADNQWGGRITQEPVTDPPLPF